MMTTLLDSDRAPALEPGEVVWANVLNPHENPACHGKPRPAILLHPDRNGWLIMGLTTNPTYANGTPRTAIDNPAALNLQGPSYLWGRPTSICSIDVLDHLGWVDETTATTLTAALPTHCTVEVLLGETPDLPDAA